MGRLKLALVIALVCALAPHPTFAQTGACCGYVDGVCVDNVTESDCLNVIFGEYMGDGTTCGTVTCAPIGACCDPQTGTCVTDTTEILCEYYWGRTWLGAGTSCSDPNNPCPQPPRGACCLPTGICEPNLTVDECDSYGGVYQGNDTLCEDVACPQPDVGACCLYTGGCVVLQEWLCLEEGGEFLGPDTLCWPNPCDSGDPNQVSSGWSDNFDSYDNGTLLYNVGGWTGWDDNPAAAGTVSDAQAYSGSHSIMVNDTSDAIHPLTGFEGGKWIITAWQYIPSGLTGMSYFVVNSYYEHGGPYYWGVEIHFDPATGMVTDAMRDANGTSALPIIYDQWVEVRIEVDFTTSVGTLSEYYGGNLLFTGDWVLSVGQLAIANIDLYAPHATPVYYDDISVLPDSGGEEPSEPVRPLFVGVEYGDLSTRTTDMSGFPDVTWNNGFVGAVSGAAGLPDGSVYIANGGFNSELYIAPIEGPMVYLCDLAEDASGLAYGGGRLFAFSNYASPKGIYEVDPLTGDMTLLVDTGSRRFFGLDYNAADGLLYGYDEYGSPSGLCAIDVDAGTITHIASSVPSANSAARGLACGDNKVYAVTVYGADYPMYEYDLAQGPGGVWTGMTHPFPDSNSTSGAAWTQPLAGDVDVDGDVDLSDLAQLLAHYGAASDATWSIGDLDFDGDVDLSDLSTLLAVYGYGR